MPTVNSLIWRISAMLLDGYNSFMSALNALDFFAIIGVTSFLAMVVFYAVSVKVTTENASKSSSMRRYSESKNAPPSHRISSASNSSMRDAISSGEQFPDPDVTEESLVNASEEVSQTPDRSKENGIGTTEVAQPPSPFSLQGIGESVISVSSNLLQAPSYVMGAPSYILEKVAPGELMDPCSPEKNNFNRPVSAETLATHQHLKERMAASPSPSKSLIHDDPVVEEHPPKPMSHKSN